MISETFGSIPYIGKDVDPRLLDHVIKGQLSYFGDWGLSAGNVIAILRVGTSSMQIRQGLQPKTQ